MLPILEKFKSVLTTIGLMKEDEEEILRNEIRTYRTIINSSKYADSNSDTTAMEKLITAMELGFILDIDNSNSDERSLLEEIVKSTTKVDEQQFPSDAEPMQKLPPIDPETLLPTVGLRKTEYLSHFTSHLKLLEELEGEQATVLPGQPVYRPSKFGRDGGTNFVLRQFRIPNMIYEAIECNSTSFLDLKTPLDTGNYVRRFQTLLWIEEAHQAIEMHRYDMAGVMLAKHEDFFLLVVPGLAEGRPSLLRGDKLVLKSTKRSSSYEGYIFEVREHDILIKLHESLHSTAMDGLRFDVTFLSSRTCFRRCHHGVVVFNENNDLRELLFPNPKQLTSSAKINAKETKPEDLRCFSGCLNVYQRRAVMNILQARCRPAPYIIFGPPGTGKTVTMVEAILQVYARSQDSKILVCGNSNACADILANRLKCSKIVPLNKMVRVSAFYRMEKLIPPEIEDITKDMEGFSAYDYRDYRVVITTCIQSGALNDFKDKFDYVFIDEAGHANEPEALISIGLMKRDGCVVLAGDPHQLGPVCISQVAASNGLGLSLLERLYKRPVYQRQTFQSETAYDERYITKLIISYRSDARVMLVNNELFYDNELQFKNETPQMWLDVLNLEQPLVYHEVLGRDRREYTNPSWFNPNEAITCLCYARRLYQSGLLPHQLGIITPYRQQIEKLNILFDSCQMKKCKITTMEEFQGDEREVIIISTVRTRVKNVRFDQQFNLGFLFNPKRFNVAISRAKWLVIVVGHPDILSRDDCWTRYMRAAQRIEVKTV